MVIILLISMVERLFDEEWWEYPVGSVIGTYKIVEVKKFPHHPIKDWPIAIKEEYYHYTQVKYPWPLWCSGHYGSDKEVSYCFLKKLSTQEFQAIKKKLKSKRVKNDSVEEYKETTEDEETKQ